MTELQQKDYEELLEQLRQEEAVCEACPHKNNLRNRHIATGAEHTGTYRILKYYLLIYQGKDRSMKAEYRPKTPIFENHLMLGKLYTVLDTKCTDGRNYGEVAEIKIKDNSGKEHWYKADRFIFYAETAATIIKPAGMDAAAGAAMPATGAPQDVIIKPSIILPSAEELAKKTRKALETQRKGGLIYGA